MQLHGIQVRPSSKGRKVHHAPHHAKMRFMGPHGPARPAKLSPEDRHAALAEQSQKWVAQTFFGQMLKQMRDSPFKSKLFSGGRGGEAFQQMADQQTAESMARGTGHKLVDALVARIEHPDTHGPARPPLANAPSAPTQSQQSPAELAQAGARLAARLAPIAPPKVTASVAVRGRDLGQG